MILYRVYVIQNPKRKMYIGFSEDVEARLQQHNGGITISTRGRGPWRLVWTSDEMDIADARRLERDLKRQNGGNGFYQKTSLERI